MLVSVGDHLTHSWRVFNRQGCFVDRMDTLKKRRSLFCSEMRDGSRNSPSVIDADSSLQMKRFCGGQCAGEIFSVLVDLKSGVPWPCGFENITIPKPACRHGHVAGCEPVGRRRLGQRCPVAFLVFINVGRLANKALEWRDHQCFSTGVEVLALCGDFGGSEEVVCIQPLNEVPFGQAQRMVSGRASSFVGVGFNLVVDTGLLQKCRGFCHRIIGGVVVDQNDFISRLHVLDGGIQRVQDEPGRIETGDENRNVHRTLVNSG